MERMTMLRAERPPGKPSAPVISFDEMWSYVGAPQGEKEGGVDLDGGSGGG